MVWAGLAAHAVILADIPASERRNVTGSLIPEKFKFCSRFAQLGHCRELGHDAHIARRGIKN
jgi:hypothetical protein